MAKRKADYAGVTRAYSRFKEHYWRTEQLLSAGIAGLDEIRKPIENLLSQFEGATPPKGRRSKKYEPEIETKRTDDGVLRIVSMDMRSASFIKKAILHNLDQHKDLHYHYFSILAVSIWGSYETYIYMLFKELFRKQPRMLKTNENLSYKDALENKDKIEQYLSDKTLLKIGLFSLNESLIFLHEKFNFKFSSRRESNLHRIYLIRNIIAHNSGVLRSGQERDIPKEVSIKNGEIRISKTYLKRMHSTIRTSIELLEHHVENKFFHLKRLKGAEDP
jgi:hypothetical protein